MHLISGWDYYPVYSNFLYTSDIYETWILLSSGFILTGRLLTDVYCILVESS